MMSTSTSTPTVTVTVMFVDISGSTRLYETLGDGAAHAHVDACMRLLARVCGEHGGRVVKTTGDGAMCAFKDADTALHAARSMHEVVATLRAADGAALGIHIGCHAGAVIENAGDLFGDAVNVAARVAGFAKVGQVITTEETVAQLGKPLAERTRQLHRVAVKGKREEILIYEYLWEEVDELTMMGTRWGAVRAARLALRLDERHLMLGAGGPSEASFGRDSSCDFVVEDRKASRQHARVERRGDKFVLVDHSSNGTWVKLGAGEPMVLRREELMLRGAGAIGFGHSPASPDAVRVEFEVL